MTKIIFLLGVATLCLSMTTVAAKPGDLLHSLFEEKSKEVLVAKPAEDNPVSPLVLAAVTAPKKYSCNADDVVTTGSTLVKNTVDIMTETFTLIYKAMHATSNKCPFNGFRCFLQEFTTTKDMISDVKDKVFNYADKAQDLTGGIAYYFTKCDHKE